MILQSLGIERILGRELWLKGSRFRVRCGCPIPASFAGVGMFVPLADVAGIETKTATRASAKCYYSTCFFSWRSRLGHPLPYFKNRNDCATCHRLLCSFFRSSLESCFTGSSKTPGLVVVILVANS